VYGTSLLRGCKSIDLILKYEYRSVNKCPTRRNYTQFILSVNCSTCFGWYLHPSSVAQTTVSTASGISQLYLLPVTILAELELSSNSANIATGSR